MRAVGAHRRRARQEAESSDDSADEDDPQESRSASINQRLSGSNEFGNSTLNRRRSSTHSGAKDLSLRNENQKDEYSVRLKSDSILSRSSAADFQDRCETLAKISSSTKPAQNPFSRMKRAGTLVRAANKVHSTNVEKNDVAKAPDNNDTAQGDVEEPKSVSIDLAAIKEREHQAVLTIQHSFRRKRYERCLRRPVLAQRLLFNSRFANGVRRLIIQLATFAAYLASLKLSGDGETKFVPSIHPARICESLCTRTSAKCRSNSVHI